MVNERVVLSRASTDDLTGGGGAPRPRTPPGSVQRSAPDRPSSPGRPFSGSADRWSTRGEAVPPAPLEPVAWDYSDPACNWLG